MIVTIDGPAGAGKSSVSRRLAERLSAAFLDTGAFYRSATLAVMREHAESSSVAEIAAIVARSAIEMRGTRVFLNGEDVSQAIRTPEVTALIRIVADNASARRTLSLRQQEFARDQAFLVTEGRDQGTEVFPDAECKIFLTASDEERARRRCEQLRESGRAVDYDQILNDQRRRDEQDRRRPVGALRAAPEAVTVMTDGYSEDEVVAQLEAIVKACRTRSMSRKTDVNPAATKLSAI